MQSQVLRSRCSSSPGTCRVRPAAGAGCGRRMVARAAQRPASRATQSRVPDAAESHAVQCATSAASTLALSLLHPALAFAEEAAAEAPAAVAGADDAAAALQGGPTALSYVVVFAPILLYGIFSVYRDQVNPRAKISDFLFIIAAVLVFANLIAILAFKVRLF